MRKCWIWLMGMTRIHRLTLVVMFVLMLISTQLTGRWILGMWPFMPLDPVYAQALPLLDNPGMEDGFTNRGAPEVDVAIDWEPFYIEGDGFHRPEYKPERYDQGSGRVHSGVYAQKTFVNFALHDGGIFQVVDGLTIGQWYEFEAWAYNWCSSLDNPDQSVGGKCSSMAGVNPWGNAWADHWTTIWGKAELDNYNKWVRVSVKFEAWSPRVVLFLRGLEEWAVKHSDWYWDDAKLKLMSDKVPTPTPTAPTPTPDVTPAPSQCPSIEDIQSVMETVVAERNPVIWPKDSTE